MRISPAVRPPAPLNHLLYFRGWNEERLCAKLFLGPSTNDAEAGICSVCVHTNTRNLHCYSSGLKWWKYVQNKFDIIASNIVTQNRPCPSSQGDGKFVSRTHGGAIPSALRLVYLSAPRLCSMRPSNCSISTSSERLYATSDLSVAASSWPQIAKKGPEMVRLTITIIKL